MRNIKWVLALLTLVVGCRHSPPTADKPAPATPPAKPVMTPIVGINGRVVLVNPELRYVVVDFALGGRPVAGRRLSVYRKDQKVGEIIISPETRESTFAADIAKGEVQVGDEVSEH